jgi:hypothetical protein
MVLTPALVFAIVHWFGGDFIGWANLFSWSIGGILIFLITVQFLPGRRRALEFRDREVKCP